MQWQHATDPTRIYMVINMAVKQLRDNAGQYSSGVYNTPVNCPGTPRIAAGGLTAVHSCAFPQLANS